MRTNASTASRLATVGAAVVLAFLLAFVAWAAVATNHRSQALSAATDKSGAYLDALDALELEDDLVNDSLTALLAPGRRVDASVRREHTSAGRALAHRLRDIRAHGRLAPGEGAEIGVLLDRHSAYLDAADHFFASAIAGKRREALTVELAEVNPLIDPLADELRTTALQVRQEATADQVQLERANRLGLTATAVVFAAAIVLLAAFIALAVRFRRRIEAARAGELARAQRDALTDSLTGLRNNRAFHEDMARELQRAARAGETRVALVLLDLDGLKQTNDTHGHQAGDELIKGLADTLRCTQRAADASYRVGGDEFAVVLTGESAWGAFRFATRLRTALIESAGAYVTAGIADAGPGDIDKDALIRRADLALISAKRSHREALIHTPELDAAPAPIAVARRHHFETLATALARAVDAKDSYTRSHCETVSELCALVADELGLDAERANRLRLAGLLHDAGKIGIADAILQKPGALTDAEFEVMKTHAALGGRIVAGAELEEEARWILHHHERPDGRGYPDGLAGDEIPIESRIILVADAFEAITSDRPYRPGRSEAEALAELDRCAGTQFDPECVAALRRALRRAPSEAPTTA
jgi:diguanylate cyclase (GGDEF)-like protein